MQAISGCDKNHNPGRANCESHHKPIIGFQSSIHTVGMGIGMARHSTDGPFLSFIFHTRRREGEDPSRNGTAFTFRQPKRTLHPPMIHLHPTHSPTEKTHPALVICQQPKFQPNATLYSFPPLIKQQKCKQSLKPRRHTYENQDTSTSHLGLCIHGFSIFPFAFTTLLFALLFSVAARPVRVRLASYPQVFHRFSTAPNF